MLQLYFWPMACSLASRIALMEAEIEARYRAVDLWGKRIIDGGGDFWEVAPKGVVPVLVLEDGTTLTENAAVLQYIADLRPELGLAPLAGHSDRYRLQEWLSFVGTEIHKAFLFPTFWYSNDTAKAAASNRIGKSLSVTADHLKGRSYLVGDRFTVADAYLTWAMLLIGRSGVDVTAWPPLVAYLDCMLRRPHVKAAIEIEQRLFKQFSTESSKPAIRAASENAAKIVVCR
jgi:glutathione S-transferase